jgi:hypothetical protein
MPGFRALILSLAIFSWIPAASTLAAEDEDVLGGDPATADLTPKWRPISYWFGNLDSKKHAYATREPGSFGAAFSSPNAVHESSVHFMVRDEIDDRFGLRRTVVQSFTWKASVSDLYYVNKDKSHVSAGDGGSGHADYDESDLAGPPPRPRPDLLKDLQKRVKTAQDRYRRAREDSDKVDKRVQALGDVSDVVNDPAVKDVMTAMAAATTATTRPGASRAKRLQASEQLRIADGKRYEAEQTKVKTLNETYISKINAAEKVRKAPDSTPEQKARALDDVIKLSQQLTAEMKPLMRRSEVMHALTSQQAARERVAEARESLASAWRFLAETNLTQNSGLDAETPPDVDEGAGADEGAAAKPADKSGKSAGGFSMKLKNKKLATYEVQILPLKLEGFKTKVDQPKTLKVEVPGAEIDSRLSAKTTREDDHVTVSFSGKGGGGEEGLIGGGTWETSGKATRYDVRQVIFVKGQVLHRLRVPKDRNELNVIMPDEPAANPPDPSESLRYAIPVAGEVNVEAWLIDPKAAATAPAGSPVVCTHTKDAGKFELVLPRTKGQTLRLEFTYANKEAQLREVQRIEVSTDAILTANAAVTGGVGAATVEGMTRRRTVYLRDHGEEKEFALGSDRRQANVKHEGDRSILLFEKFNSVFLNTFILRVPYLNQSPQGFTVKDVAVPQRRLLAARPDFIAEKTVRDNMVVGDDPVPQEGKTTVKVRGSVVCFPTCTTMILGGLGLEKIGTGKEDQIRVFCQGIYDFHAGETQGKTPPQPPWVFPFPDDPRPANREREELLQQAFPAIYGTAGSFNAFSTTARNLANLSDVYAAYRQWPFDDAADDLPKQWLISENDPKWDMFDTTTGDEVIRRDHAALRPWQNPSIVKRYVEHTFAGKVNVTVYDKTNVFTGGFGKALNELGRGALSTVSINHKDSTGKQGGHLLVLLGAVIDDGGTPVRLIFHDPYGDQTQHPDVEGYYGSAPDKDGDGEKGKYAPYHSGINSWDGSMQSKYMVAFERADEKLNPDAVHSRLLPSEVQNSK